MQTEIKSIPEKIYLVTGLYEDELNEIVDFNDLELSWSTSKEFFYDIEYIISSPPVEQTVDAGQLFDEKADTPFGVFDKEGFTNETELFMSKEKFMELWNQRTPK